VFLVERIIVGSQDAPDVNAGAGATAQVHITSSDDDIPPVCKAKPWLPQCEAPLARAASLRRSTEKA
jgi:hypothetical protein